VPTHQVASRPRRRTQAAIWLLFFAALTTVLWITNPTGATTTSPVTTVAAGTDTTATPNLQPPASITALNGPLQRYVNNSSNSDASPVDLLPAWRWRGASLLDGSDSFDAITAPAQTVIGGFGQVLFGAANLIWSLVLSLVNFAINLDIFNNQFVVGKINVLFATLTTGIWSSGLIMAALAVAAFAAFKYAMKGNMTRMFGVIAAFLIPVAALQMMATAVDNDAARNGQSPRYSPTWIAATASDIVANAGTKIVDPIDNLSLAGASDAVSDGGGLTCGQYKANLYAAYDLADSQTKAATGSRRSATLSKTLSQMWEVGYLNSWMRAQYGDTDASRYMYCQQLELQHGATPSERFAIAGGAPTSYSYEFCDTSGCSYRGTITGNTQVTPIASGAYKGMGMRPFWYNVSATQGGPAAVTAWAACGAGDAARVAKPRPGWDLVGDEKVTADACANWATKDVKDPGSSGSQKAAAQMFDNAQGADKMLSPGNPGDVEAGVAVGQRDAKDPAALAGVNEYGTTYTSIWGKNGAERFFYGAFSLLAALLYGYCIGGLALGALVAGFGFGLAIAILPVTLLLIAFNRGQHSSQNPGIKLLKLTAGLAAAKFVVIAAITIMMIFIILIQRVALGAGALSMIVTAAAPVIALLMMKTLGNKLGFGNLLSAGGAVGLTTAAVMKASGQHASFQGNGPGAGTSSKNNAKKTGTDKKDTLGKFNKGQHDGAGTSKTNARLREGLAAKAAGVGAKLKGFGRNKNTDVTGMPAGSHTTPHTGPRTPAQAQRDLKKQQFADAATDAGVTEAPPSRDPDTVAANALNGESNVVTTPEVSLRTGASADTLKSTLSSSAAAETTAATAPAVALAHLQHTSGGHDLALSPQQVTALRAPNQLASPIPAAAPPKTATHSGQLVFVTDGRGKIDVIATREGAHTPTILAAKSQQPIIEKVTRDLIQNGVN